MIDNTKQFIFNKDSKHNGRDAPLIFSNCNFYFNYFYVPLAQLGNTPYSLLIDHHADGTSKPIFFQKRVNNTGDDKQDYVHVHVGTYNIATNAVDGLQPKQGKLEWQPQWTEDFDDKDKACYENWYYSVVKQQIVDKEQTADNEVKIDNDSQVPDAFVNAAKKNVELFVSPNNFNTNTGYCHLMAVAKRFLVEPKFLQLIKRGVLPARQWLIDNCDLKFYEKSYELWKNRKKLLKQEEAEKELQKLSDWYELHKEKNLTSNDISTDIIQTLYNCIDYFACDTDRHVFNEVVIAMNATSNENKPACPRDIISKRHGFITPDNFVQSNTTEINMSHFNMYYNFFYSIASTFFFIPPYTSDVQTIVSKFRGLANCVHFLKVYDALITLIQETTNDNGEIIKKDQLEQGLKDIYEITFFQKNCYWMGDSNWMQIFSDLIESNLLRTNEKLTINICRTNKVNEFGIQTWEEVKNICTDWLAHNPNKFLTINYDNNHYTSIVYLQDKNKYAVSGIHKNNTYDTFEDAVKAYFSFSTQIEKGTKITQNEKLYHFEYKPEGSCVEKGGPDVMITDYYDLTSKEQIFSDKIYVLGNTQVENFKQFKQSIKKQVPNPIPNPIPSLKPVLKPVFLPNEQPQGGIKVPPNPIPNSPKVNDAEPQPSIDKKKPEPEVDDVKVPPNPIPNPPKVDDELFFGGQSGFSKKAGYDNIFVYDPSKEFLDVSKINKLQDGEFVVCAGNIAQLLGGDGLMGATNTMIKNITKNPNPMRYKKYSGVWNEKCKIGACIANVEGIKPQGEDCNFIYAVGPFKGGDVELFIKQEVLVCKTILECVLKHNKSGRKPKITKLYTSGVSNNIYSLEGNISYRTGPDKSSISDHIFAKVLQLYKDQLKKEGINVYIAGQLAKTLDNPKKEFKQFTKYSEKGPMPVQNCTQETQEFYKNFIKTKDINELNTLLSSLNDDRLALFAIPDGTIEGKLSTSKKNYNTTTKVKKTETQEKKIVYKTTDDEKTIYKKPEAPTDNNNNITINSNDIFFDKNLNNKINNPWSSNDRNIITNNNKLPVLSDIKPQNTTITDDLLGTKANSMSFLLQQNTNNKNGIKEQLKQKKIPIDISSNEVNTKITSTSISQKKIPTINTNENDNSSDLQNNNEQNNTGEKASFETLPTTGCIVGSVGSLTGVLIATDVISGVPVGGKVAILGSSLVILAVSVGTLVYNNHKRQTEMANSSNMYNLHTTRSNDVSRL